MGKVEPRSVTPIISALRNLLLGRSHTNPLRYGDYYAARTQPPPDLPEGPSHKLANNYYYLRDGRHEVSPPQLIALGETKLLEGKSGSETKDTLSRTPGSVYLWDTK